MRCLLVLFAVLTLASCGSGPAPRAPDIPPREAPRTRDADARAANEIVLQALGLLDTGYQFGGRNPDAGLDCSGMVTLVVERATGQRLPHNAARIAAQTRPIAREALRPGDFVFFNTNGGPFSHVGIYLGEARFVHAPSSRGRVRIDSLDTAYFRSRFTGGRTLFD